MNRKTIRFDILNPNSIAKAEEKLKQYIADIQRKQEDFLKRLAEYGLNDMRIQWSDVVYDWSDDLLGSVHSEIFECEETKDGFILTAEGEAVCFIEFGAGVKWNGNGIYPIPRPEGVVGIGEYGHHLGRFDHWYYKDANGKSIRTEGNPANMPMYHTMQDIIDNITRIAREVFG